MRLAEKVVVVMDNLKTHELSSLYEAFAPDEAGRIADKLEMHYTPKHGSWLNVAECELAALSAQCLNRRIGSVDLLRRVVAAWEEERKLHRVPIIALTANVPTHQKQAYYEAGMDGIGAKPVSPTALLSEIARIASGETGPPAADADGRDAGCGAVAVAGAGQHPVPHRAAPRLDEGQRVRVRRQRSGGWRLRIRALGQGALRGERDEAGRLARLVDAHHRPRPDVAGPVHGDLHAGLVVGGERRVPPRVGVDAARARGEPDDLHLLRGLRRQPSGALQALEHHRVVEAHARHLQELADQPLDEALFMYLGNRERLMLMSVRSAELTKYAVREGLTPLE